MVTVVASIRVKTGSLSEFFEIFKSNLPSVRNEQGCVEYYPAVDINADLRTQILDENVVTIIEKWESLDALHDHLKSPHMLAYRKKTKDIVKELSLKVLQEA